MQAANDALPWLLAVAIAALPFYKGLFNVAVATYMLCWLASGQYAARWQALTKPGRWWLALTVWVLVGMAYAGLPLDQLGRPTTFVLKASFMLMAMSAIDAKHARVYVGVFVLSNLWVVLLTMTSTLGLVPTAAQDLMGQWLQRASTDHISQGIRLALLCALLAYLAQAHFATSRVLRAALLATVAIATAVAIGYFATGRTGYLALIGVGLVFVAWRRPLKSVVLGPLLVAVCAYGAYSQSATVQSQVDRIISESQLSGDARDQTSVGARVAMWSFSAQAIQQRPLLGTGSGGYPHAAQAHFTNDTTCGVTCSHAHNQFLFFGVENGLLGVALYVGFILSALVAAWRVSSPLVSGAIASTVAVLVADSLTHGPFWIANEFHFFAVVIPVALALGAQQERRT